MNDAARMPCLVDHYAFTKDLVAPQGMNVLQPASAPDSFWQTLEKLCNRSGRPSFFRSGLPRASPATDKWHGARVAGLRDSWVANSGPLYARPKTCKCGLVRG